MIPINRERFLADLNALRQFGKQSTGVIRQALTLPDINARRFLASRMEEAGLLPMWDPVGNLFGIAAAEKKTILVGSHSDTQPQGGWLDGAYGVICGLEVARASIEMGLGGVSMLAFSDEEGCFYPLLGSRYWTGAISLAELRKAEDPSGRILGELLDD